MLFRINSPKKPKNIDYHKTRAKIFFISLFISDLPTTIMFSKYAIQYFMWMNLQQQQEETFFDALSSDERKRRDKRYPRCSVAPWKDCPFKFLLDSRNDQALLNATGLTFHSFNELLDVFRPYYYAYTFDLASGQIRKIKGKNGRKRELPAEGALGLVLLWFRTRGSVSRGLQHFFGLSSTPMYDWLRFSRRVLLYTMQEKVKESSIKKPSPEDIEIYSNAISALYPVLEGHKVWGAADGLKLPIQGSCDYLKQNRNYNGWLHGHYINSVFVFAADGTIRICSLNSPGTWHDSNISDYGVYDALEDVFLESSGKIVVDSAFKLENKQFLLRSSQQDPIGAAEGVSLNRAATSVRQLSEWGMRMIQAQFPRLKEPLRFEEKGERRVILTLMTRLYNFNVCKVGVNQILNVFMRESINDYTYFGGAMIDNNANGLL